MLLGRAQRGSLTVALLTCSKSAGCLYLQLTGFFSGHGPWAGAMLLLPTPHSCDLQGPARNTVTAAMPVHYCPAHDLMLLYIACRSAPDDRHAVAPFCSCSHHCKARSGYKLSRPAGGAQLSTETSDRPSTWQPRLWCSRSCSWLASGRSRSAIDSL